MSLRKLANLCDDFVTAAGFPLADQPGLAKDVEDSMNDDENNNMAAAVFTAMAGGVDDSTIEVAEIFATVAYRLSREDEAAAFIDVAQTDAGTAQEFRTQYAPNMAKLVELARA